MTLQQAYDHGVSDALYGFSYIPDDTPAHIREYGKGYKSGKASLQNPESELILVAGVVADAVHPYSECEDE